MNAPPPPGTLSRATLSGLPPVPLDRLDTFDKPVESEALNAALTAEVAPDGTFSTSAATAMELRLIDAQIAAEEPAAAPAAAAPAAKPAAKPKPTVSATSGGADAEEARKREERAARFAKPMPATAAAKPSAASPFAPPAAAEKSSGGLAWAEDSSDDDGDFGFAPLSKLGPFAAPKTPARKAHAEVRAEPNDDASMLSLYKSKRNGTRTLTHKQVRALERGSSCACIAASNAPPLAPSRVLARSLAVCSLCCTAHSLSRTSSFLSALFLPCPPLPHATIGNDAPRCHLPEPLLEEKGDGVQQRAGSQRAEGRTAKGASEDEG